MTFGAGSKISSSGWKPRPGDPLPEVHLQQVAGSCERVEECARDDVHHEIDGALVGGDLCVVGHGLGIERRGIGIEPSARSNQIGDDQSDDQRERRYDFEIQQRLAADATHLLHAAGAGDAEHHRAEDDRRDQHLDERDEAIAKRLQLHTGFGAHIADRAADHDRQQHPEIQMSRQLFHAAPLS